MTNLPYIQNFFDNIAQQIDQKRYPLTHKIILSFIELPADFMTLDNSDIEIKNKKERNKYCLPNDIISNTIPSIEERRHYVFTQIFAIYETLGNEMPRLIKLFIRFAEFINIKDHTIITRAQKTIWSFLLSENIKYDIEHIEAALNNELKSLNDVAALEISYLTQSFEYLQNQLRSLKNLSLDTFNKHNLLSICKLIKDIQNQLMSLIKNNKIKSYPTILTLEKWNNELNNHRIFIVENLYLAKRVPKNENSSWVNAERYLHICLTTLSAITMVIAFLALIFGGKSFALITLYLACSILFLDMLRGITKYLMFKIEYDLPITLKQTNNVIIKAIFSPILVIAASICHPKESLDQIINFAKNIKKINAFYQNNLTPNLILFATSITEKTKKSITNLTDVLKRKLPKVYETIKLIKPTKIQETLTPTTIPPFQNQPEFFYPKKFANKEKNKEIDNKNNDELRMKNE